MDAVLKIIKRMNSSHSAAVRKFWHYWLRVVYACDIMPGLKIGDGCKFPHRGLGVVINPDCEIGRNVRIGTNVVIGGSSGNPNCPKIEDNVEIGAGALIFGDVTIGCNSIIGGGSVVVKDIPSYTVAVGNPARVIKTIEKE